MKKTNEILCFLVFITFMTVASLAYGASNISNISNLFATATPPRTTTFTPALQLTPSPTAISTPAPAAATSGADDRGQAGVAKQAQSDGSTLFIDYDNKYQVTLPKDWVTIPMTKANLDAAIGEWNELSRNKPSL